MSGRLHTASEALSLRHAPSWMSLALAAGAVNGGTYMTCERFITSMTSTLSRVGLSAAAGWVAVGEYVALLAAFIVGSMLSVLPIQARAMRGQRPWHALPLAIVTCLLAVTALAGHAGLRGELATRSATVAEFAWLCSLALAMGLMNATVTASSELPLRATHMTGQANDFGMHLAVAWAGHGSERRDALRLAAMRGGKLVFFSLGALIMVPLVQRWGYLAFFLPAALVVLAMLRSFVPQSKRVVGRARQ